MKRARLQFPGWADWPQTWMLPDEQAIQVKGWAVPAGPWEFASFIYCAAVIGVLWFVVGTPGVVVGNSMAAAFGVQFDAAIIASTAAVLATAVAIYFTAWRPFVLKLLAGEANVKVRADTVTIRRRWNDIVFARAGRAPEILVEPHALATKLALTGRAGTVFFDATFKNGMEVVMRVGEQRHVVMTMLTKDAEKANALVLRLQEIVYGYEQITDTVKNAVSERGEEKAKAPLR